MSDASPAPILEVTGIAWPEVLAGDDLAALLLAHAELRDGDVVALTSKVVSKAEGRAVRGPRAGAVAGEVIRVLARRGESVIAETRHGLVLAAAGVDSSNVATDTCLLLPLDPDASAREIRDTVQETAGVTIGVVITDTAGRAWRNGQIDLAIGCSGIAALSDLSGTVDPYGNELVVTAPALADEIASAGDLVKGKTSGRPVAVLRGLDQLVLPAGEHGLGAAELVRPSELDLFGLGAREAALAAALRNDEVALAHFPPRVPVDPDPFAGLSSADADVRVAVSSTIDPEGWMVEISVSASAGPASWVHAGRLWERCEVLAAAYRLRAAATGSAGPPMDSGPPIFEPLVNPALGAGPMQWKRLVSAHWVVT